MSRFIRAFALAVAPVALLGAACSGDTNVVNQPEETSGITVSGRGEIQAPSDTGYVDLGVQVTAKTVAEARERAAKAADAVIASLKKNAIDEKDIKTTALSIQPQYDYGKQGGEAPRIVGYTVVNTVNAKVRKLDSFSKVLDDATVAGGDNVRIQNVYFGIEDNAKLIEQARAAAVKDAKGKAEQLAKLGDVKLGKPVSISETQGSTPPIAKAADAFGARNEAAQTPIQPGTGSVVVEVTVRWSLGN